MASSLFSWFHLFYHLLELYVAILQDHYLLLQRYEKAIDNALLPTFSPSAISISEFGVFDRSLITLFISAMLGVSSEIKVSFWIMSFGSITSTMGSVLLRALAKKKSLFRLWLPAGSLGSKLSRILLSCPFQLVVKKGKLFIAVENV